jgi:hypothetical protein
MTSEKQQAMFRSSKSQTKTVAVQQCSIWHVSNRIWRHIMIIGHARTDAKFSEGGKQQLQSASSFGAFFCSSFWARQILVRFWIFVFLWSRWLQGNYSRCGLSAASLRGTRCQEDTVYMLPIFSHTQAKVISNKFSFQMT